MKWISRLFEAICLSLLLLFVAIGTFSYIYMLYHFSY